MNYLVDTNVLSEATRPHPDGNVAAWLDSQSAHELFVSVVSIAEIQKGIFLLPVGQRKKKLEHWLDHDLLPSFAGRVIPLGEQEMTAWAKLQAQVERTGRMLPMVDSLLAATALCHGFTIATRNVEDFRHSEVQVINPWVESV